MSSSSATTTGGAGQAALLPRDVRYKQHMAEVLVTDRKCRDNNARAKTTVESRTAYEDYIGIPRAERLNQIVAIFMAPEHPQRALNSVMARSVAETRLALEEAVYDFDGPSGDSKDAKVYLESHNAELRQRLF